MYGDSNCVDMCCVKESGVCMETASVWICNVSESDVCMETATVWICVV